MFMVRISTILIGSTRSNRLELYFIIDASLISLAIFDKEERFLMQSYLIQLASMHSFPMLLIVQCVQ